MTWSVMADVPNPLFDSNGDPFSGAVLKAFLPGTTTSTSIALDSAGSSPQATITYRPAAESLGKPYAQQHELSGFACV